MGIFKKKKDPVLARLKDLEQHLGVIYDSDDEYYHDGEYSVLRGFRDDLKKLNEKVFPKAKKRR